MGNAIDLDQPIDYAIALRGQKRRGVVSAAVRSLDEAKQAFAKYKLVPGENGVLSIEGLPGASDDDGDMEPRFCALMPAFGTAATRLVCADHDDGIRDFGPWITRTVPRATYPADFHIEARLAPVRPLVDQFRRMLPLLAGSMLGIRRGDAPAADEAFRATIEDLADFTGDADTIALDAMIAEPQANVTITSAFGRTSSVLARLAVAHPERAGAPPAAFWKLPADTDAAFFHRGIDPTDFARIRDRGVALVSGVLDKAGVPAADRKAMGDAVSHTLDLWATPVALGKGLDLAEATKAAGAISGAKDDAAREEAERAAAEKMAGWMAVEVDAAPAKVGAVAKEWAAAWARPGVAKWVKSLVQDAPPPTIRVAPLPKGITGKDATHLEIAVVRPHHVAKGQKRPPQGKPMVLHALVMPDGAAGTGSWVVFAADEAMLVAKAKEVAAGGDVSPLGTRAGVSEMKDARVNAGGFITLRSLTDGAPMTWALGPYWSELRSQGLGFVSAMPDQGMTAVPFQFASQAGGAGAPAGTFVAKVNVPKAAIEGIIQLALH
jgi:hypothetical protein